MYIVENVSTLSSESYGIGKLQTVKCSIGFQEESSKKYPVKTQMFALNVNDRN